MEYNVSSDAIESLIGGVDSKENVMGPKFDARMYLNTHLNLKEEKSKRLRVRLISYDKDAKTPFLIVKFHTVRVDKTISPSGFKSFPCLNDPNIPNGGHEECPACKKCKELYSKAKGITDEAEKKKITDLAKGLMTKNTYITRVIDRDDEEYGPKFWKFNENFKKDGIFDKLMTIYTERNEESVREEGVKYNIFDYTNGKDINVNIVHSESVGSTYTLSDSSSKTPVHKDIELVKSWITNPLKWYDAYKVKNADYISILIEGKIPYFNKQTNKYEVFEPNKFSKKENNAEAKNTNSDVLYVDVNDNSELPF